MKVCQKELHVKRFEVFHKYDVQIRHVDFRFTRPTFCNFRIDFYSFFEFFKQNSSDLCAIVDSPGPRINVGGLPKAGVSIGASVR